MDLETAVTGLVVSVIVFIGVVWSQSRARERQILKGLTPRADSGALGGGSLWEGSTIWCALAETAFQTRW